jgi:hypothetical protein
MPRHDDSPTTQEQLREKDDLIAALTGQLEKAVNQLDRLRRSGAERMAGGLPDARYSVQSEIGARLTKAIDDWQEFDPAGHLTRIESDISQILELLTRPAGQPALEEPTPAKEKDFWAQAKERILAENPPAASPASAPFTETVSLPDPTQAAAGIDPPLELPTAPEAPAPVPLDADLPTLWSAIEKRDSYLQYLTSRLRLAESKKYRPIDWNQIDQAPDNYRYRLESLETLMQDHLRQAEIANSLERAVLARERAKLAQIKHNLEVQIKRMAGNGTGASSKGAEVADPAEQDRRWKRLFSR